MFAEAYALHSALASHIVATQGLDYYTDTTKEARNDEAHMSWGIVSSPGVISRVHSDTGGLCTASMPLVGEKYWAVGEPRREPEAKDVQRGSVKQYKDFSPGLIDERYRWEAVSLNNETVL